MKHIIACCFLFQLFIGCNKKQDEGKILSNDKMQTVLWDVFQADAFTQRFIQTDTSRKPALENAALQEKIFRLHGISKADFDTSYKYYAAHPDLMRTLLDSIAVKAERRKGILLEKQFSGKKPLN